MTDFTAKKQRARDEAIIRKALQWFGVDPDRIGEPRTSDFDAIIAAVEQGETP